MVNPAHREFVFQQFSESPNQEGKLPFRQFVLGPGVDLGKDIATAAGMESFGKFVSELNQLPDLQFYLPIAEDRTSWNGEAPVLVGATLRPEPSASPTITLYESGGSVVTIPNNKDVAINHPLMAIIPAEGKIRDDFANWQPGAVAMLSAPSEEEEAELPDCDDPCGGGGEDPPPPPPDINPCDDGGPILGGGTLCANNLKFSDDPDPGPLQGGPEIEIWVIQWAPTCDPFFNPSTCLPNQSEFETSRSVVQWASEGRDPPHWFNADADGVNHTNVNVVLSSAVGSFPGDLFRELGALWVYVIDDDWESDSYPTFLTHGCGTILPVGNDDAMGRYLIDELFQSTTGVISMVPVCSAHFVDIELFRR